MSYNTKDGLVTGYMKLYIPKKHLLKLVIAAIGYRGVCSCASVSAGSFTIIIKRIKSCNEGVTSDFKCYEICGIIKLNNATQRVFTRWVANLMF